MHTSFTKCLQFDDTRPFRVCLTCSYIEKPAWIYRDTQVLPVRSTDPPRRHGFACYQPSVGGWHEFRKNAPLNSDWFASISRIANHRPGSECFLPTPRSDSGTWASTGALNTPRTAHTATLLANGQVLVAGGEDSGGTLIASAELYNPATGKWTVTGSLATPRYDHTATLLANGEVLIAGGVNGTYTATAELYNPSTGR